MQYGGKANTSRAETCLPASQGRRVLRLACSLTVVRGLTAYDNQGRTESNRQLHQAIWRTLYLNKRQPAGWHSMRDIFISFISNISFNLCDNFKRFNSLLARGAGSPKQNNGRRYCSR
jgi:hypothetical protein